MASEIPCSGGRTYGGGINIMRHLIKLGANPAAVAYSMTTLGAGMMNSIFNFYYVKLFLNKYKISEGAFQQSQVCLCVLYDMICAVMMSSLSFNQSIEQCIATRNTRTMTVCLSMLSMKEYVSMYVLHENNVL